MFNAKQYNVVRLNGAFYLYSENILFIHRNQYQLTADDV